MKSEKQLYQWDVNQFLTELQPTAQFVDYPMGNEVIRIETDGKRCRIPDEFLQTAGFKTCYERYSDGTYKAYSFNVQSSPKPPPCRPRWTGYGVNATRWRRKTGSRKTGFRH